VGPVLVVVALYLVRISRAWEALRIRMWSHSSLRRVLMIRSQCAFIRGARGAVLRMFISSAWKMASKVGE
jgi:hypothetical protein